MVLFDIPSSTTTIDDEDDFTTSNFANNYIPDRGYAGPCPDESDTTTHTYQFTAYALPDASLTVSDSSVSGTVITAIQANDLASDSISGTFAAPD